MKFAPHLLLIHLACLSALNAQPPPGEPAAFDGAGKLIELVDRGNLLPVTGHFEVTLSDGSSLEIQDFYPDKDEKISRKGLDYSWSGYRDLPDGSRLSFETGWQESENGIRLQAILGCDRDPSPLSQIDYVIDLPHDTFVGGRLQPAGLVLGMVRHKDPVLFKGDLELVQISSPEPVRQFSVQFNRSRPVEVTDVWNAKNRSFRLRVRLDPAEDKAGMKWRFEAGFRFTAPVNLPVAHLVVGKPVDDYFYAGFGGNFCFGSTSPIADFMRDNVRIAWSRHELKLIRWDEERPNPGPGLESDFDHIRKIEQLDVPWVLSCWRLPERFYEDPFAKQADANHRIIAADKWDELLALVGEYLSYLKNHYGAEPDLFSFNEPNLGINVFFTPETHREAIKRIGRYFKENGFKTRMLLGDVTGPIDTYKYLLPTTADPEAMDYVGAIAFHSWGGATPEQYSAWAELKQWLDIPLLVCEAGTDAFAWRNRAFNSHLYGIGEIQQMQELLLYARPNAIIRWEYTGDYGLVESGKDGTVVPTSRFWMVKQLSDLTPENARMLQVSQVNPDLYTTAFEGQGRKVIHILNTGPRRIIEIEGIPSGGWEQFVTTDTASMEKTSLEPSGQSDTVQVLAPALSLTTLVHSEETHPASNR